MDYYWSDPEYSPSYTQRNGSGPALTFLQVAELVDKADTHPLEWRHIHFIATMYAESGFRAWVRPVVWKPGEKDHLSVDRGICQFNSYWWSEVTDHVAYHPEWAIAAAVQWLKREAKDGTRGAKVWDWRPLLDWQWHGYGRPSYHEAVGPARDAVNVVRATQGRPNI